MSRLSLVFGCVVVLCVVSRPAAASSDLGLCPSVVDALDPDHDEDFDGPNELALRAAEACTSQDRALGLLSQAYVLRRMGKRAEARSAITESLAIGGDAVAANRLRCALLDDEQSYEAALAACRQGIAADPKRPLGHFGLAQLEFRAGHWSQALEAYQTASRLAGESDPNLWSMIGQTLANLNRREEATTALQRAITLNPAFMEPQVELVRVYVALNQASDALKVADRAVARKPKHEGAHRWRGRALELLSRYDEALLEYDQAVKLSPEWADAYWERGTMYARKGLRADAMADYNKALALNPNFAAVYDSRGELLASGGLRAEAEADFSRATGLNQNSSLYFTHRGTNRYFLGQSAFALEDFDRAVRLNPRNTDALINRGTVLLQRHDFSAAVDSYSEALKYSPDAQPALFWRARALTELGQDQQAVDDYTALLKIAPGYMWAYYNRGTLLADRWDCDAALADFEEVIRRMPGRAYPWTYSIQCVAYSTLRTTVRSKEPDWFKRHEKLWKQSPERADKYIARAFLALVTKDNREARQWLRRAREVEPADMLLSQVEAGFDELSELLVGIPERSPAKVEQDNSRRAIEKSWEKYRNLMGPSQDDALELVPGL